MLHQPAGQAPGQTAIGSAVQRNACAHAAEHASTLHRIESSTARPGSTGWRYLTRICRPQGARCLCRHCRRWHGLAELRRSMPGQRHATGSWGRKFQARFFFAGTAAVRGQWVSGSVIMCIFQGRRPYGMHRTCYGTTARNITEHAMEHARSTCIMGRATFPPTVLVCCRRSRVGQKGSQAATALSAATPQQLGPAACALPPPQRACAMCNVPEPHGQPKLWAACLQSAQTGCHRAACKRASAPSLAAKLDTQRVSATLAAKFKV